jgi:hypothetical protein
LRVNLLSVSSLDDDGYCTLFKRGHVFIEREWILFEPQLIGDWMDRLCMLQGKPLVYDSTSNKEHKASDPTVGPRIQYFILREERESLLSTNSRLNWCD